MKLLILRQNSSILYIYNSNPAIITTEIAVWFIESVEMVISGKILHFLYDSVYLIRRTIGDVHTRQFKIVSECDKANATNAWSSPFNGLHKHKVHKISLCNTGEKTNSKRTATIFLSVHVKTICLPSQIQVRESVHVINADPHPWTGRHPPVALKNMKSYFFYFQQPPRSWNNGGENWN